MDYVPVTLTVKWSTDLPYNGVYSPDTAASSAQIAYSKDGGASWIVMESFTAPPSASSGIRYATVNLSPTQDLSQLRIRATVDLRMSYCLTCSRISGTSAAIHVYDITVSVERPTLTLFLDVDNNFDPGNPQSDVDSYVPGTDPATGLSLPIPTSGTLINTVKVIAAYTVSSGKIAPPPSGVDSASMSLEQDSAYSGIAMNYNPGSSSDLVLSASGATFGTDNTARVDLQVRDYAARGKVTASAGPIPDTAEMQVPNLRTSVRRTAFLTLGGEMETGE